MLDTISHLHLEDLQSREHPSFFDRGEGYQIFILRLFSVKNDKLHLQSHHFIITKDSVYLSDCFTKINLYEHIDRLVDECMKSISIYFKYIEEMEEMLYERRYKKKFIDTWFWIKKDLIRTERILYQAIDVIEMFLEFNSKNNMVYDLGFRDIKEHLNRIHRVSIINLDKLDSLHNFYHTIKTEKLNKNLYTLTITSAIFLPLNLIVGFFGMNTGGMFLADSDYGTSVVFMILFSIVLISTILFVKFTHK